MSDDRAIVDRLRKFGTEMKEDGQAPRLAAMIHGAADRIEALEAENANLRAPDVVLLDGRIVRPYLGPWPGSPAPPEPPKVTAHEGLWIDFCDVLVKALDEMEDLGEAGPDVGTVANRLVHIVVLHGLLPEVDE